jgi:hypothetical protein
MAEVVGTEAIVVGDGFGAGSEDGIVGDISAIGSGAGAGATVVGCWLMVIGSEVVVADTGGVMDTTGVMGSGVEATTPVLI